MATSGCLGTRAPSAWQCASLQQQSRAHRRCHSTKIQCAVATQEVCTSVKRNANIAKLQAGYLFPEIAKRRREHQEANPDASIISLGIGDTTEPIPQVIADAMANAAAGMATREGYSGYGAEQGKGPLREAICEKLYKGMGLKPSDVFVSDGSKCDIGRLQMMLGSGSSVAVQDPSYPVYVDSSVIMGMTGDYNQESTSFGNVQYMPCTPDNGFFPDISVAEKSDIIFFCSPNNPTGAAATRKQLTSLVEAARKTGSIIIYDAAYALYIEDDDCPRSIFEIPGADQVAIETCSLSKYAGFTGVRLGWTVVPAALKFADGTPVQQDFNRIMTTTFNGASVISQAGGLACMQVVIQSLTPCLIPYNMSMQLVLPAAYILGQPQLVLSKLLR
ncbi:hypothetical protein ABBQ32_010126 [Trebouxia sp. C0010 RCD-2024]